VFISGYANIGKNVFWGFFEITFPRKIAKLYQSRSLVLEACTLNQSLFSKKDAFQNTGFSHLKCQLKQKKLTQHVSKDFSSFSRRGNG